MPDPLDALYRDVLMDHYHNPRGRKKIEEPDVHNEGKNPACGDEIEMELKINGDTIEHIHVGCTGCAISVSSGSMLADIVEGKSLPEVRRIAGIVKAMLVGDQLPDDVNLGDLKALEGVRKFPVRVKCALLSWTTLVDSLQVYENGSHAQVSTTE